MEIPSTDCSSSNSLSPAHPYGPDFLVVPPALMLVLCACTLNHPLQQETFITLAGVNCRQLERVSGSGRASWEEMHWLGQL